MLVCPPRRLSISRCQWCQWTRRLSTRTQTFCTLPISLHIPPACKKLSKRSFAQCHVLKRRKGGKEVGKKSWKEHEAEHRDISEGSTSGPESVLNQATWIDALEPLLPSHLRAATFIGQPFNLNTEESRTETTNVLTQARQSDSGTDVLAELGIKHGRWHTVLWVVDTLISLAAEQNNYRAPGRGPSNLNWPTTRLLDDIATQPIELDVDIILEPLGWNELESEDSNRNKLSSKRVALDEIWMSLGSIILEAANYSPERCGEIMLYVYQIIARLHHSGCVPDHVYTCIDTGYGSALQRPPTLHLLSSRILTILSDAMRRDHGEATAAKNASEGLLHRHLEVQLLGHPFRINLHELGCGVWLDFVLWCCADSGRFTAGSWIIQSMRERGTAPSRHAVRWTVSQGERRPNEDSTKLGIKEARPGTPLQREKEIHRSQNVSEPGGHTISLEVVLSLVEASINARTLDVEKWGVSQDTAQASIYTLVKFLEPHALPPDYFDYLAVRLFQPTLFDFESDCATLQSLATRLRSMRALESTLDSALYPPSLDLGSILAHSQVLPGIHHQALENLALSGRVFLTVSMFNEIQRLVDQSKIKSINAFLQNPLGPAHAQGLPFNQEYTSSHGELSSQKLATFLDLLTDAEMKEIGQWLLYSMDVDGPLIPLNIYSQLSLTPSILRFASLTKDVVLIDDVEYMFGHRQPKPPVHFLRCIANSRIETRDFGSAGHTLGVLNQAKGGGATLHNLATIFATMIRIEGTIQGISEDRSNKILSPLYSLLDLTLHGHLSGIVGDFKKDQIKDHERGLVGLLRTVEAVSGSVVSDVARLWLPRLGQTNVASLKARDFDAVLSAVVETKGAKAGMVLWDLLCEDPRKNEEQYQGWVRTSQKLVPTPHGPEFHHIDSSLPGSRVWTSNRMLPIKVTSSAWMRTTRSQDDREDFGSSLSLAEDRKTAMSAEGAGLQIGVDSTTIHGIGNEVHEVPLSSPASGFLVQNRQSRPATQVAGAPPQANIPLQATTKFRNFRGEKSDFSEPVIDRSDITVSPSPPNPVVIPTYRTLGIIIRAAMQEVKAAKVTQYAEDPAVPFNTSEFPARANMRALEHIIGDVQVIERWGRPLFQKFGVDEGEVALDFGLELGGSSRLFSTKQLHQKYRAAKTEYEMAKMGVLADMSEVQVRKRFLGSSVRKQKEMAKG